MASGTISFGERRRQTSTGEYLISGAPAKLDTKFINDAFSTDDMHWAKALTDEQMRTMLAGSLTLGLYKITPSMPEPKSTEAPSSPRTPSPTLEGTTSEGLQQIGMARYVTDHVTFAYLIDVYIHPDHRGDGLGQWLVKCADEVLLDIPALRRAMLVTNPVVGRRFYSREAGYYDVQEESDHLVCMTKRMYVRKDEHS